MVRNLNGQKKKIQVLILEKNPVSARAVCYKFHSGNHNPYCKYIEITYEIDNPNPNCKIHGHHIKHS